MRYSNSIENKEKNNKKQQMNEDSCLNIFKKIGEFLYQKIGGKSNLDFDCWVAKMKEIQLEMDAFLTIASHLSLEIHY